MKPENRSPNKEELETEVNEGSSEQDGAEESESDGLEVEDSGEEERNVMRELSKQAGPTSTILATALSLGLAACEIDRKATEAKRREVVLEGPEELSDYYEDSKEELRTKWNLKPPAAYDHMVYSGKSTTEIDKDEEGSNVETDFKEEGSFPLDKIKSALNEGRLFFRSKEGTLDRKELDNAYSISELSLYPGGVKSEFLEVRSSELYVNEGNGEEALKENAELIVDSDKKFTGRDRERRSEAVLEAIKKLVKSAGSQENKNITYPEISDVESPKEDKVHTLDYIMREFSGILVGYEVDVEKDGVFYEATISPEGNN
ncbi:MAG: hypothetical protein ABEJ24_00940 [Candidatus Magasanikbacteria bacterium]